MGALHFEPTLCSKRSHLHCASTQTVQPVRKHPRITTIESKSHVTKAIRQCDELRAVLLKNAGINTIDMDPSHMQNLLTEKYSPKVGHLLNDISESLHQAHKPLDDEASSSDSASLSDLTQCSDEDEDAVVPSLESLNTESDGNIVPDLSDASAPSLVPGRVVATPTKQVAKRAPAVQTAYKSETEIAISRIFDLGKVSSVQDTSIPADAPYDGPSVVTMTGFGELGRYGNQIMQYIFLKCYAARHNIEEIQVPGWVGASLFGLHDRPVQRALPAAVEFRGTLANSTFTTDFIDYVKRSNNGKTVPEIFPEALVQSADESESSLKNVDMWGWFQWHTSHFAPFKSLVQETFTPVPELYNALYDIFNQKLRFRDNKKRTVVGLHLRLGDYQNIAASSFGYCAPTSWYLSWLEKIWPTLENPVLFVASDDINAVLRDFSAYDPVTSDSLGMEIPETMKGLKAGFFPDWFALTQCDVLAISNSTFSFSACMMNQRPGAQFYRAHYRGNMEEIDPWNADPIVHRDMNKAGIQAALETLQIVYNTQGSRGLAKNLLYELPYYGLRSAIMKAVLWRQSATVEPVAA